MQFKNLLVASAAISAVSAAKFLNDEFSVTAGQSFTLKIGDLDGPATIVLKYAPNGNVLNLQTETTLTSSLTSDSFTFTVPDNLVAGVAYAFEITDGSGENYSAPFQVFGATGVASTASVSATGSSSSSASASGSVTVTDSTTTTDASSTATVSVPVVTGVTNSTSTRSGSSSSTRTTSTRTSTSASSTGTTTTVPDSGAGSLMVNSGLALAGAALLAFAL